MPRKDRTDQKNRLARMIAGKRKTTTADEVIPSVAGEVEKVSWEKLVEEEILRIWDREGNSALPTLEGRLRRFLEEKGAPPEVMETKFLLKQIERVVLQGGLWTKATHRDSEPGPVKAREDRRVDVGQEEASEGDIEAEKAEVDGEREEDRLRTTFRLRWSVWQRLASYCVLNRVTVGDTVQSLLSRMGDLSTEAVRQGEEERKAEKRFRSLGVEVPRTDVDRLRWFALERGVSMSAVLETLIVTYLPDPDPDLASLERLPRGRPRKRRKTIKR